MVFLRAFISYFDISVVINKGIVPKYWIAIFTFHLYVPILLFIIDIYGHFPSSLCYFPLKRQDTHHS